MPSSRPFTGRTCPVSSFPTTAPLGLDTSLEPARVSSMMRSTPFRSSDPQHVAPVILGDATAPVIRSLGMTRFRQPDGVSTPAPMEGPGTLHLRFPWAHSRNKLIQNARNAGHVCVEQGDVVSIKVGAQAMEDVLAVLGNGLSLTERRDTRVLLQPEGTVPTLSDYLASEPFDALMARVGARWLGAMLAEDRLTVMFQPIVRCETVPSVFAYECLLRGVDAVGALIPAGKIFETARSAALLSQVDLAARRAIIREASRLRIATRIFINFTPTSIYDPDFCLKTTVKSVLDAGLSPQNIVFEVTESERIPDVEHLRRIMDLYRAQGFGLALDDLGSGYSSLNLLGALQPDYVKIDMGLVRGVHADPYKAQIAAKLLTLAKALGISSIAEGVETEEEYRWLAENGADFVQGFYFARPANPPAM